MVVQTHGRSPCNGRLEERVSLYWHVVVYCTRRLSLETTIYVYVRFSRSNQLFTHEHTKHRDSSRGSAMAPVR